MTSREAAELTVWIDNREIKNARVLSVSQAVGANVPDTAELRLEDAFRNTSLLEGKQLVDLFKNVSCEIAVKPRRTAIATRGWQSRAQQIIHWGKITGGDVQIDGDSLVITSRLDDHLFGDPWVKTEEVVYPHQSFRTQIVDLDKPTLNPLLDGRPVANMWKRTDPEKHNAYLSPASVPKSVYDPVAPTPRISDLDVWTLDEAVALLLWTCNKNQTYVRNPNRSQLRAVLGNDRRIIRNHEIRVGQRLPQLLDDLLEPLGYLWYVKYVARGNRTIEFASRDGSVNPLQLSRQQWGDALDTERSHVSDLSLRVDHMHRAVNQVEVLGEYEEIESTFTLVPAWNPIYDEKFGYELALDTEDMVTTPELSRVWRDWVLNEGGDYNGLRSRRPEWTPQSPGYATTGPYSPHFVQCLRAYDFDSLFGANNYATKRRRFYPTLTLSPASDSVSMGVWDGVFVEWWDGEYWNPITQLNNQTVQVLEDECGIRFTNPATPPEQMIGLGIDTVKVRVTATVRSDKRLRGSFVSIGSMIKDPRRQIVEARDQYKYRRIDPTSIFYDRVNTGELRSEVQDDRLAIVKRASALHRAWHHSSIGGTIAIDGIDWGQEPVGRGIESIQPANIGLRATPAFPGEKKYPVVTQVTWDVQNQMTTLHVDTFRRLEVTT